MALLPIFRWQSRLMSFGLKGYQANSEAAGMAIASTLVNHFGDEGVAKMIVKGKNVANTERLAARLEQAQMKNWLNKGVTPDYAFQALKLEKGGFISLSNPLLNTWVSYVTMTKADPYKLLLAKMKARPMHEIATTLGAAKQDPVASSIAQQVESALFDSWVPQSVDDIFKLLKLDSIGRPFFNYDGLSVWISYVTKVKGKQADEQMYKILRATYGDDELAMILAGSKQFTFADVAQKLENLQQKVWLIDGKSAKAVFTALKLNTQGDKLFISPALSSWIDYVTKLSPKNADHMMMSALKSSYKDDVLAKMILAAEKSDETKAVAEKLGQAQVTDWLRRDKSADEVFTLLKLDVEVDDLLTHPLLSTWVAYVEKINEIHTRYC